MVYRHRYDLDQLIVIMKQGKKNFSGCSVFGEHYPHIIYMRAEKKKKSENLLLIAIVFVFGFEFSSHAK